MLRSDFGGEVRGCETTPGPPCPYKPQNGACHPVQIILCNSQSLSLLMQAFDEIHKPSQLGPRSPVFAFQLFMLQFFIIQSPGKF